MKKLRLVNLTSISTVPLTDYFAPFSVSNYEFYSLSSSTPCHVYTSAMAAASFRKHKQNAYVQFMGTQEDSVIFRGVRVGNTLKSKRRKLIEDILLLGSLLTGYNWALYLDRHSGIYPVIPRNRLSAVCKDATEVGIDLSLLLVKLCDTTWQQQFENGYHLAVFYHNSNINNQEARFLANMTLWEYLYARLFGKESENLHEIIREVLTYFWPTEINMSLFQNGRDSTSKKSKNIYYVLRNQLAHSGKLPIDRSYSETWMQSISLVKPRFGESELGSYLKFFDSLTQVIVLQTLGFDPKTRSELAGFNSALTHFLSTGKLSI